MHRILLLFSLTLIVCSIGANAQRRATTKHPAAKKPAVINLAPPSAGAVKTESGLIYLITKHGTGALAKPGQIVTVHYTGTLTDGTKFDSSRDSGRPFDFTLGAHNVIKGWDEGIAKLHVGDQAVLIIPASSGYGPKGYGPIPPDATLIFIVELVAAKDA